MTPVPGPSVPRTNGPGVKFTYDDFVQFPDDGKRHELIDGEHYSTPSRDLKHQTIVGNLTALMWRHLKGTQAGEVFLGPLDVVLSRFDIVAPDVLFVSEARRHVLTLENIQGAPDLVVEIGSPDTRRRDELIKRGLYERFGVSEYWVVDPDLDLIKVYRLIDGRYVRVAELTLGAGDVLTTPLLPGLELPLTEIFAEP